MPVPEKTELHADLCFVQSCEFDRKKEWLIHKSTDNELRVETVYWGLIILYRFFFCQVFHWSHQ